MEKGGPWGKYACFYSSGIDPTNRDPQEEIESTAAKNRKKNREKISTRHLWLSQNPPKTTTRG